MKKQNRLPVIECSGTPYEIGRQYGEAARENIQRSVGFFFSALEQGPSKADKDAVLKTAGKYLSNVRIFDPDALEKVRGQADGAGLSLEETFALNCYTELLIAYPSIVGLCTSFAVTGAATKDGTTMLGQNVDWHPDSPIDLLHIRYLDGLEQFSLCLFGNSLYFLTSAGIGNCANLTLSPMGRVTNHIPLAFYLNMAMGQKTLNEAFEILRRTARGIGYYHVANDQGDMIGIESVYDAYTAFRPERDVLVHANHYETEEYKKNDGAHIFIKDSFNRSVRLRDLIMKSYGSLTPTIMMELLADHEGHPNSICRHEDPTKPPELASMSKASFIMIPAESTMYVSLGPPCENEYVEYRL